MIENCLRHKIIRDFLKNYTENRWKDLIPSLIEIGILNLQKSFNKIIFTNDEIKKILRHLQISQIEKDKNREKEKEIKENNKEKEYEKILDIKINNNSKEKDNEKDDKNKLYKNNSKQNEIQKNNINGGEGNNNNIQRMKIIDIVSNNQEKQEKMKSCTEAIIEMKNNIKNNYHYFKNNISIDFKKKLTKQKGEIYKKINIEKNKNNNKSLKKNIDKISYAISYDKDLRPASISKKINNTQCNTNNRNNIKAEYDNYNFNIKHNYSSDKKNKNYSKSKSKNKKNKYLNINLNNLNRINNMQNVQRKHYNCKPIIKNENFHKNNFYKKLNVIQTHNLTNNDINNNYHVVKFDRPHINRIKPKKNINSNSNNVSSSYNNNYRNINFISTLYQRINSNGQAIKINNDNYFSNREELNEFIRKNRIKLNIKQDLNYRKIITKSEKPSDRTNNFMNLFDEKEKEIYCNTYKNKNSEKNLFNKKDKKNSNNKILNTEEKDKINNKNELIKSCQNSADFINVNKNNPKTPQKNTINTEKDTISLASSKFKLKDIEDIINIKDIKINDNINNINNNDNLKNKENKENNFNENNTGGLKTIKIYDLNKDKKDENIKINKNFEKANGKNGECRYFNIFGYEGEDMSLTQIEKDCSGIIDSSTSNEIQMNPEFFKETPKNVFKISKSNEQSINSNNNNEGQ